MNRFFRHPQVFLRTSLQVILLNIFKLIHQPNCLLSQSFVPIYMPAKCVSLPCTFALEFPRLVLLQLSGVVGGGGGTQVPGRKNRHRAGLGWRRPSHSMWLEQGDKLGAERAGAEAVSQRTFPAGREVLEAGMALQGLPSGCGTDSWTLGRTA